MGKLIGDTVSNVASIGEGIKKRKEGKAFIAEAKLRQRNLERVDLSTNFLSNIKASTAANDLAIENINQSAANSASDASAAGLKGIGMINLIQQNTNSAIQKETARLDQKQSKIDILAANEQIDLRTTQEARYNADQNRTDTMLERGQALRSQGTAEFSTGAKNMGSTIDSAAAKFKDLKSGGGKLSFGDLFG